MQTRKKSGIACSLAFFCLIIVQLSDGHRISRDTESAMEEMSNLFRSMFPLVPKQTQYFWKTHQLGSATVQQRTSPVFDSQEEVEQPSGVVPWRLQIDFRKRGPDCMRKCITQGVLHPVQCHSLC